MMSVTLPKEQLDRDSRYIYSLTLGLIRVLGTVGPYHVGRLAVVRCVDRLVYGHVGPIGQWKRLRGVDLVRLRHI